MRTEHIYSACKYQISMKWFNTLDKATQDLIIKAWEDAAKYANEMAVAAGTGHGHGRYRLSGR